MKILLSRKWLLAKQTHYSSPSLISVFRSPRGQNYFLCSAKKRHTIRQEYYEGFPMRLQAAGFSLPVEALAPHCAYPSDNRARSAIGRDTKPYPPSPASVRGYAIQFPSSALTGSTNSLKPCGPSLSKAQLCLSDHKISRCLRNRDN
jgi:hypothetical protein